MHAPFPKNQQAKRPVTGAWFGGCQPTKIAALLVQLQLDGLGADYFSRRAVMIESVTLEDARRVAKRLLDKGLLVTVVGKPQGFAASTSK